MAVARTRQAREQVVEQLSLEEDRSAPRLVLFGELAVGRR